MMEMQFDSGSNGDRSTKLYREKINKYTRIKATHTVNASLGMPQEEAMHEEWQQAVRILDRFFGICCFLLMVLILFGVYFRFT